MIEVIITILVVGGFTGWSIRDSMRMDREAKKNEVKIREGALAEIDRAGLSVGDFPKYEDALNGERHLKVGEVVDIYYRCRTRGRNSR